MSKIEDALKKAKQKNVKAPVSNVTSIADVKANDLSDVKNKQNIAVTAKENPADIVSHKSSAKEIAKMKQDEVFESNVLNELRIITSTKDDDKLANTYRDLRTKLLQSSNGENFIAMVTSVSDGVYSSNCLLNLAAAFSFDESKTSLIIDCNINKPRLNKMLSLGELPGITDYLEDEKIDVNSIVHKSGIKRLRLIPAGTQRETATEYFTSLRMRNLTSGLLQRYTDRFIFIDSSPIIDSADTRILSELCDFVILVVPYGHATTNKIKEATDAIGKEKLLGVIFSEVPRLPSIKSLFSKS